MARRQFTRREFLKLIGAALLGGAATGCVPSTLTEAPTSTPLFSATATSTSLPPSPTSLPTAAQPTATPTTTSEPTAEPTLEPTSTAVNTDVLTLQQKERLRVAASRYIAKTEEEAIQVARSMKYVQGDGHPASMCGPLSVAILRDAGLLSPYIDLHEFWLLDPRNQMAVLEKTFPPAQFEWYQTDQPIQKYDFKVSPLKVGDFLYLYAGDPGSFEHMLTVSRVDEQGRAYSVTNYETADGYFIDELLLYDPNLPGIGQFYVWTDRKYVKIGLTGFGGFLRLRFAAPVPDPTPQELALAEQIDRALEAAGGDWKILIQEVGGQAVYSRRALDRIHVASVIKLPIAILFFKAWEIRGVTDLPAAMQKGAGGRSYEQLLLAMLVNSEEAATEILLDEIRMSHLNIADTLSGWGVGNIDLEMRHGTVQDLVTLAERLYAGALLGPEATRTLLDLLEAYTPNDDLRLGVLRKHLPPGYHFYNKRGTITQNLLVVADLAIVNLPTATGDSTYVLAVFAFQGAMKTTYEELNLTVSQVAEAFWDFTQGKLGSVARWGWM